MRLLHRLAGRVPVWPMDPLPAQGSLVVEIYTRAFIRLAGLSGRKVRSRAQLDDGAGGARLAGRPRFAHAPNDHETDVLIAAAGLRAIAGDARYGTRPASRRSWRGPRAGPSAFSSWRCSTEPERSRTVFTQSAGL